MFLGSTSKDCRIDNMKKTGLKGYVHAFPVNYNIIDTNGFLDIHKYLMIQNNVWIYQKNVYNIIKCLYNRKFAPIKFISLNNQSCQAKSTLINMNSDETLFYPFAVNKSGGDCNTIDNPYAQFCIPNKVKNMNVKLFNLMSTVNVD